MQLTFATRRIGDIEVFYREAGPPDAPVVYFRTHQPPLLAVCGRNDLFFIPPGAEAYRHDLPDAEIHFLDTGHFALETHHTEIAGLIRHFLGPSGRGP